MAGSRDILVLIFRGAAFLFSAAAALFTFPATVRVRRSFFTSLPTLVIWGVFFLFLFFFFLIVASRQV